jgi:hypothetical protein
MACYQLYKIDGNGERSRRIDIEAASDNQAIAEALFHTESRASFVIWKGEREVAAIDVNNNWFLFSNRQKSNSPRPPAIMLFEIVFTTAISVSIIHVLIGWAEISSEMLGNYRLIFAILLILTYGLLMSLCLLVSRRRSVIAKWLLLAIFAYIVLTMLRSIAGGRIPVLTPTTVTQLSLDVLALSFLFTPTAQRWISLRPQALAVRVGTSCDAKRPTTDGAYPLLAKDRVIRRAPDQGKPADQH